MTVEEFTEQIARLTRAGVIKAHDQLRFAAREAETGGWTVFTLQDPLQLDKGFVAEDGASEWGGGQPSYNAVAFVVDESR